MKVSGYLTLMFLFGVSVWVLACGGEPAPIAAPPPTANVVVAPTAQAVTASSESTVIPTPMATPEPTHTPAPTATEVATATPAPTATAAPTPTSTPAPTATPVPLPTVGPTATSTPRPTATPVARVPGVRYIDDPDVPYMKWEIGPEAPESHYRALRDGILLMDNYAKYLDVQQPYKSATLYLYHNPDTMAPSYARVRGESVESGRQRLSTAHWRGWAGDSFIFIRSDRFTQADVPAIRMVQTASHELVHIYQKQLAATGTPGGDEGLILRRGPVWLIEGSADFLALRAMEYGGVASYEEARNRYASTAARVDRPLEELGTYDTVLGLRGSYQYSTMACELLAATAGEDALMDYWLPPGPGDSPEDVFRKTFGMTLDEFYTLFEEHRAAGFPEVELLDIAPRIPLAEADREALTALYRSTGGVHWGNNDNWLSDEPGNKWHGVETDADGHVVVLDLRNNALNGEIPPQLGNLVNLRELRLRENQLRGEIPEELGNLSNLEVLSLARNRLGGTIPPVLGNLTNLRELRIWSNDLDGEIPSALANLTKLRVFSLGGNALTGEIPPWLGDLTGLRTLYVSDNRLTGEIPDGLGELRDVRYFLVDRNRLHGEIPSWLIDFPLRELYLNDNQFSGEIPEELGELTELEALRLGGNNLAGCVPQGLADVPENDLSRLGLPDC